MVARTSQGYSQLLRDNYTLLRDSVEGFYAGNYAKALEIAVRLRTLIHQSDARPGQIPSRPLLDFIDPGYLIFAAWLRPLFRKDWVVYSKPPFGGPDDVLQRQHSHSERQALSIANSVCRKHFPKEIRLPHFHRTNYIS